MEKFLIWERRMPSRALVLVVSLLTTAVALDHAEQHAYESHGTLRGSKDGASSSNRQISRKSPGSGGGGGGSGDGCKVVVFSDIDDTLLCTNGDEITAAMKTTDLQFPKGTFYPGVKQFHYEMSIGASEDNPLCGVVALTARWNPAQFAQSFHLPSYKGISVTDKNGQVSTYDQSPMAGLMGKLRDPIAAAPLLGFGHFGSKVGQKFAWSRAGQRKYDNIKSFDDLGGRTIKSHRFWTPVLQEAIDGGYSSPKEVKDERFWLPAGTVGSDAKYFFIGDDSQGDVLAGTLMLNDKKFSEKVGAVFIHMVTEDSGRLDRSMFDIPDDLKERIIPFKNYVEAAIEARKKEWISPAGLKRIVCGVKTQGYYPENCLRGDDSDMTSGEDDGWNAPSDADPSNRFLQRGCETLSISLNQALRMEELKGGCGDDDSNDVGGDAGPPRPSIPAPSLTPSGRPSTIKRSKRSSNLRALTGSEQQED